jgi:hypothetical protein
MDSSAIKSPRDITGKQALLMIPLTKYFCQKNNIEKLQEILEGRSDVSLRLIDWFVTNYSKKNNVMYNLKDFNADNQPANFNDLFNVFNNYKSQLKSFNKKNFDPFCRRVRIHFYYTKDKFISTTVGQLNFFKWLLENHIIDYIKMHLKDIEADMISTINNDKLPGEQITIAIVKSETKKKKNKMEKADKADKTDKLVITISDTIIPAAPVASAVSTVSSYKVKEKKTLRKKRRELSEPMSKSIIRHNVPITITFD